MFLSALFVPNLHDIALPMFATIAMVWLLTMKRTESSIGDISTTFLGMFYIGWMPSYWIRIRLLGIREHTRLAPIAAPAL